MPAQETFVAEVEVMRMEMKSCDLVVEGEFWSEEKMYEMGYSEYLVNKFHNNMPTKKHTLQAMILRWKTLENNVLKLSNVFINHQSMGPQALPLNTEAACGSHQGPLQDTAPQTDEVLQQQYRNPFSIYQRFQEGYLPEDPAVLRGDLHQRKYEDTRRDPERNGLFETFIVSGFTSTLLPRL